jgi:hypothetical protein
MARKKASKGARVDGTANVRNPQGNPKRAGNVTNPRIGSGVQQTRKASNGVNHQGGEKPRRWNRTGPLARAGRSDDQDEKLVSRPAHLPKGGAGVDDEADVDGEDLWKTQERSLNERTGRKDWNASPSGRCRDSGPPTAR